MLWQWSPSVVAELAASAILLVLAIYFPWRDLNRQARLTGVTLVFFCALWIQSHAIEIGLPVISYKESLVGLQLVLGMMALTFWLFYILHYLGPRKLLTWRIYILFGIMPLIAILAIATNSIYGLMWTGVGLDSRNPYLPLDPTYGIIYWACMVYVAMLTLTGSLLIIWNIIRRRYGYSRQSIYLLVAAILPLIVAFIEVTGLTSFLKTPVGLTPWAGCIGAIILIFNLPQLHAEQVIPIARDITFERIGDCILVLDMQNRVLDLNPAAEQLIGYRISDAFGLSIERIWPYQPTPTMPFNKMAKEGEEMVLERDGKQRTYDLHLSTITDSGGRLTGQVVLLADITERKLSEEKLLKSYESLKKTLDDAINTMAKIVETRDPYTSGHQQKVAGLAIAIAREMKLEDIRIDQLRMAAVIHDIGKMYVPSDILSKPGKLSDMEFALIKTHPQSGYDIVKGMDFPCNVAKAVLQHHERLDGSGYPNQLRGEDTLLEAKILAVADVVEAMASHRPYRPALGIDKALEEISKNKGELYDPDVVDACLELFNNGKFEFNSV